MTRYPMRRRPTSALAALGQLAAGRMLRSHLLAALVAPRSIDEYLALFDPLWSTSAVRARIVEVKREGPRAVSLLVEPNAHWRGFRAGQHVTLAVRLDGVRYLRCFSLSCAPQDGTPLRLTIQMGSGGRVSRWAVTQARAGDLVELGCARGEFVLPAVLPERLLFISGGSGITPLVSMARHLASVGYDGELNWIHYARGEALLADELRAQQRDGARVWLQRTDSVMAARGAPHFQHETLERLVPAWSDCHAYLCGPPSLMHAVARVYQRHGLTQALHREHFGPMSLPSADTQGAHCRIDFVRSARSHDGQRGVSLLLQAEAAGLKPRSGCRMGICRSCIYRKVSGVVRNELTGQRNVESDVEIQLCVSSPESDVVLDL